MTEPGHDLDIRLLGPVRVRRAGVAVAGGADRRAAVLGVLALRANRPVSREELVAAVWGDDQPVSALGNIYTAVSELRRVVNPQGGQVIRSAGGGYLLQVPDRAVDVWRYEQARAASRATADEDAELTALEEALGLWQGEALAGVPGPFAAAQRARLTELRLADVERQAELLLGLGRHDEAIAALRQLVEAYPLQEKFHGLLMTALHAGGRSGAALTTYREARRLLTQLTGNEPGPVLQEAYRTVTGAAAPPVPRKTALVGRDTEVHLLRHAAAQVAAGTGGHIRFEGPPGIGKSMVLAAGLRTARPDGYRIGWSHGDAGASPLGTLVDCLRSATGETWDGLAAPEDVVTAVREACAEPLILVIDDLHLADDATLRIWPVLQRLTERLPLFLVTAARPDRLRLGPLGWTGAMPLGPLAPGEATALVEAAAERPLSVDRIQRIITDAGGNPCYLLASVEAVDAPGEEIPAELMAAVTRQLAVLSEPARQVLRAIAFLGDDCDMPQLATATAKPTASLLGAIDEARAAGFLGESAGAMAFRHRIVARVLHDGTPAALRVMLHRSFAEQLARAGLAPRQVIAQLLAGPVPLDAEMSAWLVHNVESAAEQSPREAVEILELAHREPGMAPEIRLRLTVLLARLLFRLDLDAAQPAGWVAARTTDTAVEAEMRWLVALGHERRGESAKAAEVARWVLSARKAPDDWLDRFRALLARIRPRIGGLPTKPHEPTATGHHIDHVR